MVFFSNALLTKDGKFASIWCVPATRHNNVPGCTLESHTLTAGVCCSFREAANMGMSKQMVCNPRKGNQSRKWANVKIAVHALSRPNCL